MKSRITGAEVISYFAAHAAEPLQVKAESPGFLDQPAFEWLAPADGSKRAYGDFRIDVFHSSQEAERVTWPGRSEPDETGFRWTTIAPEHAGDEWCWLASKVYGNLLLSWWNNRDAGDSRLEQLDAVLTELVQPSR